MDEAEVRGRRFGHANSVVAFPLGGIGTGNVSLGARGELRDWELENQPHKGGRMPCTFFALRAAFETGRVHTRVLEGPIAPPHDLSHGYHPHSTAGLPRFAEASLAGAYPIAHLTLGQPDLPLAVTLEAYTPFVPLDPDDSGLPVAVLTWGIRNDSAEAVVISLAGSLINPIGGLAYDGFGNLAAGGLGGNRNRVRENDRLHGVFLDSERVLPDARRQGDLTLATTHPSVSIRPAWLRGAWYDFLQDWWDDFSSDGRFDSAVELGPSPEGLTDTATVAALDRLEPGGHGEYRFLLAWSFPNRTNTWWNEAGAEAVRNHYATRFETSWDTAMYVAAELRRLEAETHRFTDALFGSTLPTEVIDCLSATIVPVRSPTTFRLEDGRFLGFEGCFDDAGSCEGSCTHVWSYAQAVAMLFPSLEREMRRIELANEVDDEGWMAFRTHATMSSEFTWPWGPGRPQAAIDGQMGTVLRAYREWRMSGERAWLDPLWPAIDRAMRYVAAHWDGDGDGVPDEAQHTTYDIELHGPNPLGAIYYLAALRAWEGLAEVMGEAVVATQAREMFERTSPRVDELLWSGSYYVQRLDDVDAHKYQHGSGCLSDQLLGQLHARLLDLGDLLPAEHVHSAIRAVFQHNFRTDFRDHVNCQRTYALNDDAGLVLCSWPHGGRPRLPFVYSDEVWTGVEYQVAAELIYEGAVDEGLEVVRAVHGRHDGVKRNPWDEVECGHHYVRSMAAWALLPALSGWRSDASSGSVTIAPRWSSDDFRCLFSAGTAWGRATYRRSDSGFDASLDVHGGSLHVAEIRLPAGPWSGSECFVRLDDAPLAAHAAVDGELVRVTLGSGRRLGAGERLWVGTYPTAPRSIPGNA